MTKWHVKSGKRKTTNKLCLALSTGDYNSDGKIKACSHAKKCHI